MAGVPFINTPFTRLTRYWVNTQASKCYQFEHDYIECATYVGMHRATKDCRLFLEDMIECSKGTKQRLRKEAMDRVRRYKGRPYIEGPPDDIIVVKADLN